MFQKPTTVLKLPLIFLQGFTFLAVEFRFFSIFVQAHQRLPFKFYSQLMSYFKNRS